MHSDIDGVTGASTQGNFSITRTLSLGSTRRFKVCFDVDRSWNSNSHFPDRPAFTYSTGIIDLDSLSASYPLSVAGWMSNGTTGSSLGQYPSPVPSGFATYTFMTDLGYIQDAGGSLNDMITSIQAVVTQN
jgi:hypothetical protein